MYVKYYTLWYQEITENNVLQCCKEITENNNVLQCCTDASSSRTRRKLPRYSSTWELLSLFLLIFKQSWSFPLVIYIHKHFNPLLKKKIKNNQIQIDYPKWNRRLHTKKKYAVRVYMDEHWNWSQQLIHIFFIVRQRVPSIDSKTQFSSTGWRLPPNSNLFLEQHQRFVYISVDLLFLF